MSGLIADPSPPGGSIVNYKNFTPPPDTPDKLAVSVTPGSRDQYAIDSDKRPMPPPGPYLDTNGQLVQPTPEQVASLGGQRPTAPASNADGPANPIKDAVREEWLAAGYPPAAVEGIMKRVGDESGWNIHSIGDGGTSFGLYQHHADRAQRLAQYLENIKVDVKDSVALARAQTKFAISEMNGGDSIAAKHKGELQNPNISAQDAYGVFTSSFARPAGSPGSAETNLRRTALGSFNDMSSAFLQRWQGDIQKRSKEYDDAIAEAKDLRSASRAALKKWEIESEHPPKDMRDTWNQWAGAAIGLALLGGFFGKNHTASINAAGEMLQAANAADVRAYDIAYKRWKDHNDNGLKLVELLHGEARDIVEDARKSYDQKVTELATLSTAYQLQQHLDPTSLENIEKSIRIQKERADLITSQNVETNIRLTTDQYDKDWADKNPEEAKKWAAEHPGQSPVPPNVHAENYNKATRLMTGAAGATKDAIAQQIYSSTLAAEIQSYLAKPENAGKTTADIPPDEMARIQSRAGTAAGLVPSSASRAGTDPKLQAAEAFKEKIRKEKGTDPTYEDWVKFSQDTGRSQTGQLSPDAVKLLARQYEMGDPAAITSMPRGGPARIQVENQIAEDMKGIDDASRQIVMNRLRMAEAQSAARSAGRITMNTELYVKAAEGAGKLVVDASKAFPRTNFPKINDALAAYERNTGDPNIIRFGASINALLNEYGKMSNPTGTGIHDADKDRLARILDTGLSQGQIEGAVQMIVAEGRNISDAAMKAQYDVLSSLAPAPPGQQASPAPAASPSSTALPTDLPPATGLKEGAQAKDESGKVVAVIRNGQWVAP